MFRRFRNQVPPPGEDEPRPYLSLVPPHDGDDRWKLPPGAPPPGQYKPLVEWRGAIELGHRLYPRGHDDMFALKFQTTTMGDRYALTRILYTKDFKITPREKPYPPAERYGQIDRPNLFPRTVTDVYPSLDALMAGWPELTGKVIWSLEMTTIRTQIDRLYMFDEHGIYVYGAEEGGEEMPNEMHVFL